MNDDACKGNNIPLANEPHLDPGSNVCVKIYHMTNATIAIKYRDDIYCFDTTYVKFTVLYRGMQNIY